MANRKEISQEEIAKFLEGRDLEEGIVNFDYSYRDDFITVYKRDKDDLKHVRKEPFYPFLWATEDASKRLFNGDRKKIVSELKLANIWCKSLDVQGIREQPQEKMVYGYKILFYATKPMSYKNFLNFFKKAGNPVFSDKKDDNNIESVSKNQKTQYMVLTPQEQYMIRSGKRMFKGFDDYDQLLRMIFDLETEGLDPKQHRITLNGIRFNREVVYKGKKMPFEKILKVKGNTKEELDNSELDVIDKMLRIIYTFRPDVITAHNGEVFDWPFIMERCRQLGTTLEDMSAKYFDNKPIKKMERESILKLGGEVEKFQRTIVPTCIITDSMHAVRRAQASDSNFKEFNLKYATKYLGLNKKNRVYIPGGEIDNVRADKVKHYALNDENGDWYLLDEENGTEFKFDGDTKRTFIPHFNSLAKGYELVDGEYIADRYLLDDLYECDKVEYALNGTDFMLTKIIPINYQKVCTMGTASQWKAIMMAWSYENNLAIPKAENTGSFTGGLSRLLKVGYVDNVIKLDYNSLYPSILLTWGIEDEIDILGATLKFLEYTLTTREKHKGLKKAAGKIKDSLEELFMNGHELTEQQMNDYNKSVNDFKVEDNRQMIFKRVSNSFFGSYGSNNGQVFPWKSQGCAERTTCTGRQSLRLLIHHFSNIGTSNGLDNNYNYIPIVGDSFSEDTPILIKYKSNGCIDIKPISELIDESAIHIDELGREYDYSRKDYLVLCRSGWIEPSYIYRHKTDKDIYEVTDGDMKVEVTEDHSLFNSKQEKIKPSEIDNDTELEYYDGEILSNNSVLTLDIKIPETYAIQLANGEIDRVPMYFLNRPIYAKRFYNTFIQNSRDDIEYSKTCLAGLYFLKMGLFID